MKLQRLAGYGPTAAFVSAACLFGFAAFQAIPIPPGLVIVVFPIYVLTMVGWAAALTVTVFDLEWMEHAATRTGWIQAALIAAVVATVAPLGFLIAQYGGVGAPYASEVSAAVLLLGVGFTVLVHNIEARRAGLLRGALPWIGIVTGACWIYLGTLQFIYMFTPVLLMGFVYGLPVSELLYLVWAIWLGVHLTRTRKASVARPVAASATTN